MNLDAVEQFENLAVKFRLGGPRLGMPRGAVAGTAVVNIAPVASLGLLDLPLAGDGVAAVAAMNQLTAESQQMRLIGFAAKQNLHASPRAKIDDRLMFARIPVATLLIPHTAATLISDGF